MRKILMLIWCVSLFIACKKEESPAGAGQQPAKDFNDIFERFWNGMNTNYVYWDIDPTDWNAVYYKYKPAFEKLNMNDSADIRQSLVYFRQMTSALIDGHFQLTFENKILDGNTIYPALERKQQKTDFYFPFDYQKVDYRYFDKGYMTVYDNTSDAAIPLRFTLATINKKILYLSFNKFSLTESYNSARNNNVRPALDTLFKKLKEPAYSGLIIDVRNNFGGDLADLNFLMGYLIDHPLHFGYSRYKSKSGKLDYTPWIETIVNPHQNSTGFKSPVIVLTDNFTVSLSETIAMAIHTMPNGKIVGDTTWGATGPLTDNEVFKAESFEIPGFLKVYTSSAAYKYIDNRMYEGIGFKPDVPVLFDLQKLNSGVDPALEKAVSLIN